MNKRMIAICLVSIMCFVSISFAEANHDDGTLAEDYEIILQGGAIYYTEDYQDKIEASNKEIENYINRKISGLKCNVMSGDGGAVIMSGGGNTLNVPLYKQELSYWCGPASTQMTIKYVKGTKYTQTVLADKLGTDQSGTYVYKITAVLNSYITTGQYQHVLTSASNFGNSLIYSIDGNRPIICHTNPQYLPGYPTGSTGHYVVVNGYAWGMSGGTGFSNVKYNDPNPKHYGNYTCSVTDMTTAINKKAGYYIRKI